MPWLASVVTAMVLTTVVIAQSFPKIVSTQNPKDKPPTAAESAAKLTLPKGFRATLFAGDPDVQQPIAMAYDDRGRLWVVECYTFNSRNFDKKMSDRIVIFEDRDHDGKFDVRKVVWNKGHMLTGIEHGFGGIWILNKGTLSHMAIGADDQAGQMTVHLDGFTDRAQHNIANGLKWGPDGWLYGRHGILATSTVGAPGTPKDQRTKLNCAIWRYHPTRKIFEIVCHGTTNPWGFDYDDHGQMFMTNNVIGHAWHIIPGAHYKRMYGEDFNPHIYNLIDQQGDHYHWDTSKSWGNSRGAKGKHGELGGGHSHSGGLIYLGDNWPKAYRGSLLMCNTHGRRINRDVPTRLGSGYVIKHSPDFMMANQPWFKGVELITGPDGAVMVSDWVDFGECHDHDGVHRTSGRLYKIVHGQPKPPAKDLDLSQATNEALVAHQLHANDWYVRKARRVLQERAAAGRDMGVVHLALRKIYQANDDATRKLRAMWALHATGAADEAWLSAQLVHENEHVRSWAVRLLVDDGNVSDAVAQTFAKMASTEKSGLVRLFLASALQRVSAQQVWPIATALAGRTEDTNDRHIRHMIWYGIESHVPKAVDHAIALAKSTKAGLLRYSIARRLTHELKTNPESVDQLVAALATMTPVEQREVLNGMNTALRGWVKAKVPASWAKVSPSLAESKDPQVRKVTQELSSLFGDGRALEQLQKIVNDKKASADARREALRILAAKKDPKMVKVLFKYLSDRVLDEVAAEALAAYDHPETPKRLIGRWEKLDPRAQSAAIGTLASRPAYAKALLVAVRDKKIKATDISAFHARQMVSFGDTAIEKDLTELWGQVRRTSDQNKKLIEKFKNDLTKDVVAKANASKGRVVFNKLCLACHKLYGEGGAIGPDLTGGGRQNLDYLLHNIVDPSGAVADQFRLRILTLKGGQVVSGSILSKTAQTYVVQTAAKRVNIEVDQVEKVTALQASLMPEGLLQTLKPAEVRDLIKYLMTQGQVALPK
jgi:putative membrane-bound dehydrogenase-like protein